MVGRKGSITSSAGLDRRSLSAAEWTGLTAFFLYLPLWQISPRLAAVPLVLFVMACAISSFCPTVSFFLPVISRGTTGKPLVSLTFDDGPAPASTPLLLQLLERHGVSATFFVTGERAGRYPYIIRQILAGGHTIGNHSYSHDDYLMFRSVGRIIKEIDATQRILRQHGVVPRFFRPPVGILTPGYGDALHATGLTAVNFSRRARDLGNRRIFGLAGRTLRRLCRDDIILLHDVLPPGREDPAPWLVEVEAVITGTRKKGLDFAPLETLVGREVMQRLD